MLHSQRPCEDLGHDRVVDVARGQSSRRELACRRNVGLRQTATSQESGKIRVGAPGWLWRQCASRSRIQFALQLRRQRDRSEVLELHIVGNPESAANGSFPVSAGIVGESNARCDVVLVRLGNAEGDDARDVGDGVEYLGAVARRIGPILVPHSEV